MNTKSHFIVKALFIVYMSLFLQSCSDADDKQKNVSKQLTPSDPNHPGAVIGPMEPVSSIPYAEIPGDEYMIELDRWDIPNNRTSPEKTTDNLQAAIDWAVSEGYGRIHLPAGHYLIGKYGNDIYQAGIELKSNMAFLLEKVANIIIVSHK